MAFDNCIDSLVHRQFADRGTEDEHEYIWLVTGEEEETPISLDVMSAEGVLTVSSDTDIGLREFMESVEKWYAMAGRDVLTGYSKDEKWHDGRPGDIVADTEDIEMFSIQVYDDYDFFGVDWINYDSGSLEHSLENEVSLTLHYDNADGFPEAENVEPLVEVFPNVLRTDASDDLKRDVVIDLLRYMSSPRDYKDSYDALLRCSNETVRDYYFGQST